jgi:hypothetical protein
MSSQTFDFTAVGALNSLLSAHELAIGFQGRYGALRGVLQQHVGDLQILLAARSIGGGGEGAEEN